VILLDTSVLIDSLSGHKQSARALREAIVRGERIQVPALVLYEWLRGPRIPEELAAQEALFPSTASVKFGPEEAGLAAELYRSVPRPRGREVDLAIASCAITWDAVLWTLNVDDFSDIPGLRMSPPP
jgi:predicted nucleic acid-binding protein